MSDLFEEKHIAPMLIAENVEPFADEQYLYEMKWDGERCVAYLDPKGGTELRNKRNVRMLPKVPELAKIHRQAKRRCVLDGELLCLVDGKPSFETIQRRSLMSNRYRIELEAKKYPATFVAFDCLYYDGEDLTLRPLTERKEYLQKAVTESERLAVSRVFDAGQALALFQLAREQGLEGIVAKKQDSLYFQGKRTKSWLKMKNLMDDDYVVCGWIPKDNHMTSIVLGQYDDEKLKYKGHVTLGVGGSAFAKIQALPPAFRPPFDEPVSAGHGNEHARWVEPRLICVVEYMHKTQSGGMRQPVFKGLREDKRPEECTTFMNKGEDYHD